MDSVAGNLRRAALPLFGLGILLSAPAMAQQIEDIVVTARKKEESLQDVPISIQAFTGDQMRERGITNNYELANFTPNFNTVKQVGRSLDRPVIRGQANPGVQGEPNASYFIDGMFVSSSIATATTASMERAEVLRGPQSALFGRATFSGAVNYVTRKPTDVWEGEANARYGSSETYSASGWFSGPLIEDRLLFLVSAGYEHYGGQWNNELQEGAAFTNPGPDPYQGVNTQADRSDLGEEKTYDFMTKLTWLPTDGTEFNLKYSYTEGDDGHWPSFAFVNLNCLLPGDPGAADTTAGEFCGEFKIKDTLPPQKNIPDFKNGIAPNFQIGDPNLPDEEVFASPVEPGQRRETHRVFLDYIQDFGEWTSTLKTAYNNDEYESAYDLDHQQVRAIWGLFAFNEQNEYEDYAIEWSVESPVDAPIRGKLGVYYFDFERNFRNRSFAGPNALFSVPPGANFGDDRIDETTNQSVFGSVGVDLSDQWELLIEARYSKDEKDITSGQRDLVGVSMPVSDSREFTNFTPRMTLNFRPTDDVLFYGLVSKGNKPGGFNQELFRSDVPSSYTQYAVDCVPGVTPEPSIPDVETDCATVKGRLTFEEEEQWTYEAGFKSTWFDRRIVANFSAFYIDWTNQGIFNTTFVPSASGTPTPVVVLENAGKSKIVGFELESNFAVTDNLFLIANYGYNDGEYTEGESPDQGEKTGDADISGNTIAQSPKHSIVLGMEATAPVGTTMDAFLRADVLYETKRYINADNFNWTGDRKIVNVRTGVSGEDWTLTLYVSNLLDDQTPITALNFVNFAVDPFANGEYPAMYALNPLPGRDYGLEFSYRFGE